MYLIGVFLCFAKSPQFMDNKVISVILWLAVIPGLMMLFGVGELVSERIQKLDRLLPRKRLLRGFGALTYGGVFGTVVSVAALIYCSVTVAQSLIYLILMSTGAILCAVFAGLIYRTFHRKQERKDWKIKV